MQLACKLLKWKKENSILFKQGGNTEGEADKREWLIIIFSELISSVLVAVNVRPVLCTLNCLPGSK